MKFWHTSKASRVTQAVEPARDIDDDIDYTHEFNEWHAFLEEQQVSVGYMRCAAEDRWLMETVARIYGWERRRGSAGEPDRELEAG